MQRVAQGVIFVWVGVVVLLGMVTGCDTASENMEIRPVSLGEIHGQTGYLIRAVGHGGDLPKAAFRADKWSDSDAPIFFMVSYNPKERIAKDIEFLLQASVMSLSFRKPTGIPILSTISIGDTNEPTVTAYLIASVNTHPLYLRIITNQAVYDAHHEGIRTMVSKSPGVIQLPGFPNLPTVSEEDAREIANGLLNCFYFDWLKLVGKSQREHFVNFRSDWEKLLKKYDFTYEIETGFWTTYLRESPYKSNTEDVLPNGGWFLAIARELFYLEALHPEKTKEEIIEMCNQLIRDGTINLSEPIGIPYSDAPCPD